MDKVLHRIEAIVRNSSKIAQLRGLLPACASDMNRVLKILQFAPRASIGKPEEGALRREGVLGRTRYRKKPI